MRILFLSFSVKPRLSDKDTHFLWFCKRILSIIYGKVPYSSTSKGLQLFTHHTLHYLKYIVTCAMTGIELCCGVMIFQSFLRLSDNTVHFITYHLIGSEQYSRLPHFLQNLPIQTLSNCSMAASSIFESLVRIPASKFVS